MGRAEPLAVGPAPGAEGPTPGAPQLPSTGQFPGVQCGLGVIESQAPQPGDNVWGENIAGDPGFLCNVPLRCQPLKC